MTRHLIAENDEFWLYDIRDDGTSIGCDLVPKEPEGEEPNEPYADASDECEAFQPWLDALAEDQP